ncbi:hypothetical protein [Hungatella sp.]|uniref:hypothetical protein n=1 Tax=Hungatella sp. TaxID=2613924 RepID=UPI0039962A42
MTSKEIRAQVPPMIIWMADATIKEARRGITGKTGWKDIKRHPYNIPEVEMAGEVLGRMFNECAAGIRQALIDMPEEMDGVHDYSNLNYFDEFVASLEKRHTANLREADWILERC